MQHQIACKSCSRLFGVVEICTNLEITCPWCHQTTVYDTHNGKLTATLLRGRNPEDLTGEDRFDELERLMRSNRGVDGKRC